MISYSTEITSSKIHSDNPLFQRTLKAYHIVEPLVGGNCLEIGCGEGYGISIYKKNTVNLTVIDKAKKHLNRIKKVHKDCLIFHKKVPDMNFLGDDIFDTIISFQVIEHIKDYDFFLHEISRILKPGGKAFITTPNRHKTIAPNPWHYKEFNFQELSLILNKHFSKVTVKGIQGNAKTNLYYDTNNKSVQRILKYDILKLADNLPSPLLKIPYEIGNRINRVNLHRQNKKLVSSIGLNDYNLNGYNDETLDFFCILEN